MNLNIDPLLQTCTNLRNEAVNARALGGDQIATTMEACVDRFQLGIDEWLDEMLSPTQAGAEGPYAASTIAKYIREGLIQQDGRRGAPFVKRGTLFGVSRLSELKSTIRRILDGDESNTDPDDPFSGHE